MPNIFALIGSLINDDKKIVAPPAAATAAAVAVPAPVDYEKQQKNITDVKDALIALVGTRFNGANNAANIADDIKKAIIRLEGLVSPANDEAIAARRAILDEAVMTFQGLADEYIAALENAGTVVLPAVGARPKVNKNDIQLLAEAQGINIGVISTDNEANDIADSVRVALDDGKYVYGLGKRVDANGAAADVYTVFVEIDGTSKEINPRRDITNSSKLLASPDNAVLFAKLTALSDHLVADPLAVYPRHAEHSNTDLSDLQSFVGVIPGLGEAIHAQKQGAAFTCTPTAELIRAAKYYVLLHEKTEVQLKEIFNQPNFGAAVELLVPEPDAGVASFVADPINQKRVDLYNQVKVAGARALPAAVAPALVSAVPANFFEHPNVDAGAHKALLQSALIRLLATPDFLSDLIKDKCTFAEIEDLEEILAGQHLDPINRQAIIFYNILKPYSVGMEDGIHPRLNAETLKNISPLAIHAGIAAHKAKTNPLNTLTKNHVKAPGKSKNSFLAALVRDLEKTPGALDATKAGLLLNGDDGDLKAALIERNPAIAELKAARETEQLLITLNPIYPVGHPQVGAGNVRAATEADKQALLKWCYDQKTVQIDAAIAVINGKNAVDLKADYAASLAVNQADGRPRALPHAVGANPELTDLDVELLADTLVDQIQNNPAVAAANGAVPVPENDLIRKALIAQDRVRIHHYISMQKDLAESRFFETGDPANRNTTHDGLDIDFLEADLLAQAGAATHYGANRVGGAGAHNISVGGANIDELKVLYKEALETNKHFGAEDAAVLATVTGCAVQVYKEVDIAAPQVPGNIPLNGVPAVRREGSLLGSQGPDGTNTRPVVNIYVAKNGDCTALNESVRGLVTLPLAKLKEVADLDDAAANFPLGMNDLAPFASRIPHLQGHVDTQCRAPEVAIAFDGAAQANNILLRKAARREYLLQKLNNSADLLDILKDFGWTGVKAKFPAEVPPLRWQEDFLNGMDGNDADQQAFRRAALVNILERGDADKQFENLFTADNTTFSDKRDLVIKLTDPTVTPAQKRTVVANWLSHCFKLGTVAEISPHIDAKRVESLIQMINADHALKNSVLNNNKFTDPQRNIFRNIAARATGVGQDIVPVDKALLRPLGIFTFAADDDVTAQECTPAIRNAARAEYLLETLDISKADWTAFINAYIANAASADVLAKIKNIAKTASAQDLVAGNWEDAGWINYIKADTTNAIGAAPNQLPQDFVDAMKTAAFRKYCVLNEQTILDRLRELDDGELTAVSTALGKYSPAAGPITRDDTEALFRALFEGDDIKWVADDAVRAELIGPFIEKNLVVLNRNALKVDEVFQKINLVFNEALNTKTLAQQGLWYDSRYRALLQSPNEVNNTANFAAHKGLKDALGIDNADISEPMLKRVLWNFASKIVTDADGILLEEAIKAFDDLPDFKTLKDAEGSPNYITLVIGMLNKYVSGYNSTTNSNRFNFETLRRELIAKQGFIKNCVRNAFEEKKRDVAASATAQPDWMYKTDSALRACNLVELRLIFDEVNRAGNIADTVRFDALIAKPELANFVRRINGTQVNNARKSEIMTLIYAELNKNLSRRLVAGLTRQELKKIKDALVDPKNRNVASINALFPAVAPVVAGAAALAAPAAPLLVLRDPNELVLLIDEKNEDSPLKSAVKRNLQEYENFKHAVNALAPKEVGVDGNVKKESPLQALLQYFYVDGHPLPTEAEWDSLVSAVDGARLNEANVIGIENVLTQAPFSLALVGKVPGDIAADTLKKAKQFMKDSVHHTFLYDNIENSALANALKRAKLSDTTGLILKPSDIEKINKALNDPKLNVPLTPASLVKKLREKGFVYDSEMEKLLQPYINEITAEHAQNASAKKWIKNQVSELANKFEEKIVSSHYKINIDALDAHEKSELDNLNELREVLKILRTRKVYYPDGMDRAPTHKTIQDCWIAARKETNSVEAAMDRFNALMINAGLCSIYDAPALQERDKARILKEEVVVTLDKNLAAIEKRVNRCESMTVLEPKDIKLLDTDPSKFIEELKDFLDTPNAQKLDIAKEKQARVDQLLNHYDTLLEYIAAIESLEESEKALVKLAKIDSNTSEQKTKIEEIKDSIKKYKGKLETRFLTNLSYFGNQKDRFTINKIQLEKLKVKLDEIVFSHEMGADGKPVYDENGNVKLDKSKGHRTRANALETTFGKIHRIKVEKANVDKFEKNLSIEPEAPEGDGPAGAQAVESKAFTHEKVSSNNVDYQKITRYIKDPTNSAEVENLCVAVVKITNKSSVVKWVDTAKVKKPNFNDPAITTEELQKRGQDLTALADACMLSVLTEVYKLVANGGKGTILLRATDKTHLQYLLAAVQLIKGFCPNQTKDITFSQTSSTEQVYSGFTAQEKGGMKVEYAGKTGWTFKKTAPYFNPNTSGRTMNAFVERLGYEGDNSHEFNSKIEGYRTVLKSATPDSLNDFEKKSSAQALFKANLPHNKGEAKKQSLDAAIIDAPRSPRR